MEDIDESSSEDEESRSSKESHTSRSSFQEESFDHLDIKSVRD